MTDNTYNLDWPTSDHTDRFGRDLATQLHPGDIILLTGPVGAGKTHFARALIQSILETSEDVPSPTFTLVQVYDTLHGAVWHADLYRVATNTEIDELGLFEAFENAICLIEWPDRLGPATPAQALSIDIEHKDQGRTANLNWSDARWTDRLSKVLHDA